MTSLETINKLQYPELLSRARRLQQVRAWLDVLSLPRQTLLGIGNNVTFGVRYWCDIVLGIVLQYCSTVVL